MDTRRTIALFLSLLLLAASAGCGGRAAETASPAPSAAAPAESAAEPDKSVTVTDMKGRTVTLASPAERIVALSAAECEILYAIGAGGTLVGRGEYCDYPEEVLRVPAVQSGSETNIEQIISLKPQVVVMSTMAQDEEQISSLEAAGIEVVVSEAKDIEGVYTSIQLLGALMGSSEKADALVAGMRSTFTELREKVRDRGGKSVYFEVSPLEFGIWTAGKGTFMDEIAAILGLENIFADVDGWAEVSEEQVLDRDPDIIVSVAMYFGEGPTPEEEIRGRQGWQNVTAIRNGMVLNEATNALVRPGPRLADGARILCDFIYGA